MKALEAYLKDVRNALSPTGAFVRADRGAALLVTDLPRRCARPTDALAPLLARFTVREAGGLIYLTPIFPGAPEALVPLCVRALKQTGAAREKTLRQALAVEMRGKNREARAFLEAILEGSERE